MLDNERLKGIIRELYGDLKLVAPKEELDDTMKCLGITEEDANEIGCPSMADYIEIEREHCSFVGDKEKMVDFFALSRQAFLNSYSYLDEEDYNLTIEEIFDLCGYSELKDDVSDKEGPYSTLRIATGTMVNEWLMKKKKEQEESNV